MNSSTKTLWLKIIGWAILIHIILIAMSFFEVFIYSTFINPGQELAVYQAHAESTAPYVSIIFGFIFFFLVLRLLSKNRPDKRMFIVIALPFIYILLDFLMLQMAGVDWTRHVTIFIISFLTKGLGGYLGALSLRSVK